MKNVAERTGMTHHHQPYTFQATTMRLSSEVCILFLFITTKWRPPTQQAAPPQFQRSTRQCHFHLSDSKPEVDSCVLVLLLPPAIRASPTPLSHILMGHF